MSLSCEVKGVKNLLRIDPSSRGKDELAPRRALKVSNASRQLRAVATRQLI